MPTATIHASEHDGSLQNADVKETAKVQNGPMQRNLRRDALQNRIYACLVHISRYSFEGQARLAKDVGVSRSTISRFLRGHTQPSYALVEAVAGALSARAGRRLDPRELVTFDGTYPTGSTCGLLGCSGCLPETAYDVEGCLRAEWHGVSPGEWCRFPEMTGPEMAEADTVVWPRPIRSYPMHLKHLPSNRRCHESSGAGGNCLHPSSAAYIVDTSPSILTPTHAHFKPTQAKPIRSRADPRRRLRVQSVSLSSLTSGYC